MLKFTISILLFFVVSIGFGQDRIPNYTERYSIRLGMDLSKPIRSLIENDYHGLELTADYRITEKLYLAAEMGMENKRVVSETLDFETHGEYLKLGIDFNLFKNWQGMENMLLAGFRLGTSTHRQQLHAYAIRQLDHFWEEELFRSLDEPIQSEDLDAFWVEILAGVKAELLRNLYMGISVRMNYLLKDKEMDNFSNLYVPGYHRVSEAGSWGVGLNYTIMYQLPIYRK